MEKLIDQRSKYIQETEIKIVSFQGFYHECLAQKDNSLAVYIMTQIQFLERQVEAQKAIVRELQQCIQPAEEKIRELQTRRDLLADFLKNISENLPTNEIQILESQTENRLVAEIDSLIEKAEDQKMLHESVVETEIVGLTEGQIQARIESFNAQLEQEKAKA